MEIIICGLPIPVPGGDDCEWHYVCGYYHGIA